jgi:hypothetical protein
VFARRSATKVVPNAFQCLLMADTFDEEAKEERFSPVRIVAKAY